MPDVTVTLPPDSIPRLKAALRQFFPSGPNPADNNNPFPEPTDAEYLALLREKIRAFVRREVNDFERRKAVADAESALTDIDVD
jgi:hypothetical protein